MPVKFLHLDVMFHLPDEFDGDLVDAVEELNAYMQERRDSSAQEVPVIVAGRDRWKQFQFALQNGARVIGKMAVGSKNRGRLSVECER